MVRWVSGQKPAEAASARLRPLRVRQNKQLRDIGVKSAQKQVHESVPYTVWAAQISIQY